MFTFEYCKKVEVSNNSLKGDVLGKNIKLIATSKRELHLKKQQGIIIDE